MHPAALDPDHLLAHCRTQSFRGSGPGGQHRNTTHSGIHLTHTPTAIAASASERRHQSDNLRVALFRLRVNLALTQRGHFTPADSPSPLWRSRTSADGRIALNPEHSDFPAMLAEALDILHACKLDPAPAADLLGCTATQLIKLLKQEPRALAQLNADRHRRHLHPLR